MDIDKYRYRRKGAGPRRFFLVEYWWPNGLKVRELSKGNPIENPIDPLVYRVRDVDPAVSKVTVVDAPIQWGWGDFEMGWDELDWDWLEWDWDDLKLEWVGCDWDDEIGEEPISRSRARPQNEEEMRRVDALLNQRRREKSEVPNDVDVGNEINSDIHFLRCVKGEFWKWFYQAGFEPPISEDSDRPNHRGYDFAEALYDYLDLEERDAEDVDYPNAKTLIEEAGEEKSDLSWTYGHIIGELGEIGFYPTDDSFEDQTHRRRLLELCRRIKAYEEDRKMPSPQQ